MAIILNGRTVRDTIQAELKKKIEKNQWSPTLVIIHVGDRADSNTYIHQKKIFGDSIGARVIHRQFPESVDQETLVQEIKKYNQDSTIHGILVQLPLPIHLHKEVIIEAINPKKDIDGLTAYNTKLLFDGLPGGHIPATSRSIISLLDFYSIPIAGKKVVIVGRSTLVGKPTALALLNRDATITIAHKETTDLKAITRAADILIVAIGDSEFIDASYVSKDQVIIDVGISVHNKKIYGDINFKEVEANVGAITPVPGGVGPMTVASVFLNLIDAYNALTDTIDV